MLHLIFVVDLQRAVFVKYPELRRLALATIASIEDREQLERHFLRLDRATLHSVCEYLHLVPPANSPEVTEAGFSQVRFLDHECCCNHVRFLGGGLQSG
jgi:hypothetical protein